MTDTHEAGAIPGSDDLTARLQEALGASPSYGSFVTVRKDDLAALIAERDRASEDEAHMAIVREDENDMSTDQMMMNILRRGLEMGRAGK